MVLSAVALMWAGACSTSYEQKDVFPAKPGLVMPDASGQAVSEAVACAALLDALGDARTRLSCTFAGPAPACPGYVRPPGGKCGRYDQGSVDACVSLMASYTSCAELESKPCIVTVLGTDPSCPEEPADAGSDAEDAADAEPEDATADGAGDASDGARDAARDAPAG